MTAAAAPSGRVGLPGLLAETMAVQTMGTAAVLVTPALAPVIAPDLGVSTSAVGYQISLLYFAAMAASVVAGTVVARVGPCRTGQIAMALHGLACVLASTSSIGMMLLATLVNGFGYGLINPAASDLLMRHTPAERRNLIFSLKQTGVPLGGMAAGLLGPQIALALGWHAALWVVAVACVLVAVLSQLGREKLDAHRSRGGSLLFALSPLKLVMATPALRWLAFASFFFSAVQLCAVTFLVVLLVEDLGFTLVQAGALLAAMQVSGAVGRVFWGQAADMLKDGLLVLLAIALVMGASAALVTLAGPGWPLALTAGILMVLGLTAVGWNGVYLSEVARQAPHGTVSAVTGASMVFTFTGVVLGPMVFAQLHGQVGSYLACYGLLTAFALAGAAMIGFNRWAARRSAA